MSDRRPLGDMLRELGRVTEEDVADALAYQREHGGYFGEALVALGRVSQSELDWTLASQFDLPYVFPSAEAVDPAAAALVTPDWALKHTALPIARTSDRLTLVVASPLQRSVVAELERTTGLEVELALASSRTIRDVTRKVFAAARQRREGLTTSEPVPMAELWRLVRDSGAQRWGVSVREERAIGWYDHGTTIRRYHLQAGWNRILDGMTSPAPSDRLPGLGEASWMARLDGDKESVLMEVRALATPEGRELLFTHRETLPTRDDPAPLPGSLLDELRLLVERGEVVLALQVEPLGEGRKLLPRLPSMLLPAGHRALHLSPEGESMRIPGVLALPMGGSAPDRERRIRELRDFRFDAVSAELDEVGQKAWTEASELAPTTFLLLPAENQGVSTLSGTADWLLELRWSEGEGRWSWTLTAVDG
jgi:hypothetical protein